MTSVLYYDESTIFGGHQISAVWAAESAARRLEVSFAYNDQNVRLGQRLGRSGQAIRPLPIRLAGTRWQTLLAPIGIGTKPARRLLEEEKPDLVVAVQGSLLTSNRIIETARRRSLPVVSFLPMALPFDRMSFARSLAARAIAAYHYRRPNAFITISMSVRSSLLRQGARSPVYVAQIGPDLRGLKQIPRSEARSHLGLPYDAFVIGLVGRIVFAHKGHDLAIRAMAMRLRAWKDLHLLVVGDGPDEERLRTMASEAGIADRLHITGWSESPEITYCAMDMLVIPSRFEGLPLVALEAMYYGLKIVATDVDGLAEVIPREWRVPYGDSEALARKIDDLRRSNVPQLLEANRQRVIQEYNAERFSREFAVALEAILAQH